MKNKDHKGINFPGGGWWGCKTNAGNNTTPKNEGKRGANRPQGLRPSRLARSQQKLDNGVEIMTDYDNLAVRARIVRISLTGRVI